MLLFHPQFGIHNVFPLVSSELSDPGELQQHQLHIPTIGPRPHPTVGPPRRPTPQAEGIPSSALPLPAPIGPQPFCPSPTGSQHYRSGKPSPYGCTVPAPRGCHGDMGLMTCPLQMVRSLSCGLWGHVPGAPGQLLPHCGHWWSDQGPARSLAAIVDAQGKTRFCATSVFCRHVHAGL